ncbi:hypothetical protein A0J48_006940 [Sphaerospermopsis aphanizomenoides BCCUSP55]|uniref:hypothetical protein n=1 Tax=Sphaerospermopsis aphanizomenoides TaxID=459663 RepID=UPI0019033404|nr:hypothetical protein [Sphaerospermopsis aphanizomenoides]MBK1987272.1 hypothetical protein [Sphaerospermopsis aphanizomenoides BCCUSP55]
MTTRGYDPAFPSLDSEGSTLDDGLSKREYFAVTIMQGLLAGGKHLLASTPGEAVRLADLLINRLNANEKTNSEEPTQDKEGTEA